MQFLSAYHTPEAPKVLYALLAEREPHQNISHRSMPTFEQHMAFMGTRPYPTWMVMYEDEKAPKGFVGAFYVTHNSEVGIFVFKARRGQGYGTKALKAIMDIYPGMRLLANINPANKDSIRFFEKHGGIPLQITYTL